MCFQKLKKKWFGQQEDSNSNSVSPDIVMGPPPPLPPSPPPEDVRLVEVDDGESKYAYSAEVATAAVSKVAAAATSQSAVKVDQGTVLPTIPPHFVGKTKKEVAAIRIQTAFRGYLV